MSELPLDDADLRKYKSIQMNDAIYAYTEHVGYKEIQESQYILLCYKPNSTLEEAWRKQNREMDYVLSDVLPKFWPRGNNVRLKSRMVPRRCLGFEGKEAHSHLQTLPLATGIFRLTLRKDLRTGQPP